MAHTLLYSSTCILIAVSGTQLLFCSILSLWNSRSQKSSVSETQFLSPSSSQSLEHSCFSGTQPASCRSPYSPEHSAVRNGQTCLRWLTCFIQEWGQKYVCWYFSDFRHQFRIFWQCALTRSESWRWRPKPHFLSETQKEAEQLRPSQNGAKVLKLGAKNKEIYSAFYDKARSHRMQFTQCWNLQILLH